MNDTPATSDADEPAIPTQAELYDDLRRIGELEDKKQEIQKEISERTERLRKAIDHLEPTSLLHQMLTAALAPRKAVVAEDSDAKPRRKASRKKKVVRKRRK